MVTVLCSAVDFADGRWRKDSSSNAHPFHYDENPKFAKALSYKDVPILEIEQVRRDKLKRLPGMHFAK